MTVILCGFIGRPMFRRCLAVTMRFRLQREANKGEGGEED